MTNDNRDAVPDEDLDVSRTETFGSSGTGIFHGVQCDYDVAAGRMPIPGPEGTVDAQIFHVAYSVKTEISHPRPIIFFTNGGPGAATAWLHAGGLGPWRVVMNPDGSTPPPPASIEHNEDCVIPFSDLVFMDGPGTGYSRAGSEDAKERLFQKSGDLEAYVSFIWQYLAKNNRWNAPIYLFGESYGALRVAALSDLLMRKGLPVSGVIVMSAALDFQLLSGSMTNLLPFMLAIPTFASVAAHHNRIQPVPGDLNGDQLRSEAQQWAEEVYLPALLKGARLDEKTQDIIARGLVRFTGLPEPVIRAHNLRIEPTIFMQYLQWHKGVMTGRTDGRISGIPVSEVVEEPYYDPSMGAMTPAFSSAVQQILTGKLGVTLEIPYRMYSRDVASRFLLGQAPRYGRDGYSQSLTGLHSAAAKNPTLRILSLQAIYDLACPYWSAEYGLDLMPLPADQHARITKVRLHGGHMAYTDARARQKLGKALVTLLETN